MHRIDTVPRGCGPLSLQDSVRIVLNQCTAWCVRACVRACNGIAGAQLRAQSAHNHTLNTAACRHQMRSLTSSPLHAVQMTSPKALLQQMCHKSKPPLPAPRLQKISRAGEPPRYACTIEFPKAKASKSKKQSKVPSGTRTWQVLSIPSPPRCS